MVRKGTWAWPALWLALAIAGCSKGDSSGGDRTKGSTAPTGTAGTGFAGASSGGGTGGTQNFGNGMNGGTAGANGGGMMIKPPPPGPVDPSAAPFARDDTGMAGLDPGTLDKLKNGSGQCSLQVLYPYEGTMFAGGLMPPIIMWGGAADAAYVHFAYDMATNVDYSFAAGKSNPGSIQIPRDAWNEVTRRTNSFRLIVTLKVLSGGNVQSCELHWKVAPGNMIGAVYYNTYQAPASLGGVADEGAVMRISLGSQAEIYKQYMGSNNGPLGPCYSCHSVSFNGSVLVASYHDYLMKQFHVEKYDVTQATQPNATGMVNNANFGALTPKGDRILAMGNPQCTGGSDTFPRAPNNFPLVEGPDVARMLDTASGMDTNAAGLNKDYYMWMPQFSPDGDKVVFNHAKPDGKMGTDRTELAVMDYDASTNTFSNLRVVVSAPKIGAPAPSMDYAPQSALGGYVACGVGMCGGDGKMLTSDQCSMLGDPPMDTAKSTGNIPMGSCTGPCYPAWPFFTPDGKAVIFSLISDPDFAQAFPGRDTPSKSELWYTDIETGEVVRLDNANAGLKDIDKLNNYYPTVMPVAVGGYFWMFWTAVRDYGTKVAGRDPNASMNDATAEAIKKRIWAAAIRPKLPPKGEVKATSTALTDPSFPGFYLDGQSDSGNVRAFAALNPCMANGASCESGLDCCCGYCLTADGQSQGMCSCEPPKCAKINERCDDKVPCCPPAKDTDPHPMCIGGYCAFLGVQ